MTYHATLAGRTSTAQVIVQAPDLRHAEARALSKAGLYLDPDDPGPVTVPRLHEVPPARCLEWLVAQL